MPLRLDRALEVDRRKDVIMIVIIFVFGVVLSIHNSVFALSVGVLRSTGRR